MKGIVFTELMEMAEARYGLEAVEIAIQRANPSSKAAYTSVGNYPHTELVDLVLALAGQVGTPPNQLMISFGHHLFRRFTVLYPQLFTEAKSAWDFLCSVHDYIHVEVKKLYPDAELPVFTHSRQGEDHLELTYSSPRPLANLAQGLIEACLEHFGGGYSLSRKEITPDGCSARFLIRAAV
jgi:hypothetical protein